MTYKRIESDDELKRRVALAKQVLASFDDDQPDWDPPRDPKVRARIAWGVAGAQLSAERSRLAEAERVERQRARLLAAGVAEIERLAERER